MDGYRAQREATARLLARLPAEIDAIKRRRLDEMREVRRASVRKEIAAMQAEADEHIRRQQVLASRIAELRRAAA